MNCFMFEAAGQILGIEARYIYRIVDHAKPIPVPLLPSCHRGIIYDRGELFDLIDVCLLLGEETPISDKTPYIILLKWDQRKLGLIPDRIVGIQWIEDANSFQSEFTREGNTLRLITPEEIWKMVSDLPYGY